MRSRAFVFKFTPTQAESLEDIQGVESASVLVQGQAVLRLVGEVELGDVGLIGSTVTMRTTPSSDLVLNRTGEFCLIEKPLKFFHWFPRIHPVSGLLLGEMLSSASGGMVSTENRFARGSILTPIPQSFPTGKVLVSPARTIS